MKQAGRSTNEQLLADYRCDLFDRQGKLSWNSWEAILYCRLTRAWSRHLRDVEFTRVRALGISSCGPITIRNFPQGDQRWTSPREADCFKCSTPARSVLYHAPRRGILRNSIWPVRFSEKSLRLPLTALRSDIESSPDCHACARLFRKGLLHRVAFTDSAEQTHSHSLEFVNWLGATVYHLRNFVSALKVEISGSSYQTLGSRNYSLRFRRYLSKFIEKWEMWYNIPTKIK